MTVEHRPGWVRSSSVVLVAWLTLTTALAAVNHVALFRKQEEVERQLKTTVDTAQLLVYEERLAALQQQLSAIVREPPAVADANYQVEREALMAQLEAVKGTLAEFARSSELQALRDQIRTLEQQSVQNRRTPRNPPAERKPQTQPEVVVVPPFAVLGLEARAGERFLSLLPLGSMSLADAHLLRVGESFDNWRLAALDAKAAIFQHGDRQHRVELP